MATQPDIALPSREPPARRLSFEEFLDWCDDETRAEWVDGRVEVMSPSSEPSQRVLLFLASILRTWIEVGDRGWLYAETFLMRLPESIRTGRIPDLLFVASEHGDRRRRTYLDGPADLAVEIISPESVGRDRGEKYIEYERAGIPEYWMIDPDREQAEFYELGAGGRYRLALGGREGIYRSRVLDGFWLDLEWLWADPPPKTLDVLRQLGLLPS
jgi:Uma2 family endonuclease